MIAEGFSFKCKARDGAARRGQLTTPHGTIETPAFMSVATLGAVRGVAAHDLVELGAQILLANTYHLHERPGEAIIQSLGGLHGFTAWQGPWLTDSGGFQVTSLSDRVSVTDEGVTFSSPLDGTRRLLTPESVIGIQEALGSDIAMVLDECLRPLADGSAAHSRAEVETALEAALDRTLRWAERSAKARKQKQQAVFGIVQGGISAVRRRRSARLTGDIGFDGYAHGGLGLGEEREERRDAIACAHDELDPGAPRYLMGLGKPLDILDAVAVGVDLFDCVVPTRNGRNGTLYTRSGIVAIRNAIHADSPAALEEGCDCYCCKNFSRAYLHHLSKRKEMLAATLGSLHNLRFYQRLMSDIRAALGEGRYEQFSRDFLALYERRDS